jgi:SAM-dependent methyltransferase
MGETEADYRLYEELAEWWPLISPPAEYADEAVYLAAVLGAVSGGTDSGGTDSGGVDSGRAGPDAVPTMLDLGSGGGHNATHLKRHFAMTLVDLSEQMLTVSRQLNPECAHVRGDMRTIRLDQAFDVVLVHDAVDYMTTEDDLALAIETAFRQCRPGGIALFVPDHTAESFRAGYGAGEGTGGGSDATGRQASFREVASDPDPGDDWIQVEYEFRLRSADGTIAVVRETHQLGAFSRAAWLRLILAGGFEALPASDGLLGAAGVSVPGRRPRNLFLGRRPD